MIADSNPLTTWHLMHMTSCVYYRPIFNRISGTLCTGTVCLFCYRVNKRTYTRSCLIWICSVSSSNRSINHLLPEFKFSKLLKAPAVLCSSAKLPMPYQHWSKLFQLNKTKWVRNSNPFIKLNKLIIIPAILYIYSKLAGCDHVDWTPVTSDHWPVAVEAKLRPLFYLLFRTNAD